MNKGELAFLFVIAVVALSIWLKYQSGSITSPVGRLIRMNSGGLQNIMRIEDGNNRFVVVWTKGSFSYYTDIDALTEKPIITVLDYRIWPYCHIEWYQLKPDRIRVYIVGIKYDIQAYKSGSKCYLAYIPIENE